MTRTDQFHADQIARLARIGLTDEAAINDNERESNERHDLERRIRAQFAKYQLDDKPGRITHETAGIRGEIDGHVDAALGRPASAVVRFVESNLHYNNYDRFEAYRRSYLEAYQRKTEQDRAA